MGRSYAGVLGSLGFFTVTVRGLLYCGGPEETLLAAVVALAAMGAAGFAIGQLGGWIVDEAVRSALLSEATGRQTEAAKKNNA